MIMLRQLETYKARDLSKQETESSERCESAHIVTPEHWVGASKPKFGQIFILPLGRTLTPQLLNYSAILRKMLQNYFT